LHILAELIFAVILKLRVSGAGLGANTVAIRATSTLELAVVSTFGLTAADERSVRIEFNTAAQAERDQKSA